MPKAKIGEDVIGRKKGVATRPRTPEEQREFEEWLEERARKEEQKEEQEKEKVPEPRIPGEKPHEAKIGEGADVLSEMYERLMKKKEEERK